MLWEVDLVNILFAVYHWQQMKSQNLPSFNNLITYTSQSCLVEWAKKLQNQLFDMR